MELTICVSKYNEVSPDELETLFNHGARLIKSQYKMGVPVKSVEVDGNRFIAFSDDDIEINNIKLPLSSNDNSDYYNYEITINVIN